MQFDSSPYLLCRLVETIVDKLRHSQIMMMRCKLLQLLRKIVAKHQVDHSFIAEEIFKQINDCGKFVRDITLYRLFVWVVV